MWYNMELDQIQNERDPKLLRMIDILGREGWERALDGYDRQAVLLRKKIL